MRTYYDPEDDTGEKIDRHERLMELADHLRDEAKDRLLDQDGPSPEEIAADAMCDALDAIDFTASSDAAETSPVAMLPAKPSFHGSGDGEATGEEHLVHDLLGGMLANIREFCPHGFTTATVEMDSISNSATFVTYNERFGHYRAGTAAGAVTKLYQSTGGLSYHDALLKKASDLKHQAATLEAEAASL